MIEKQFRKAFLMQEKMSTFKKDVLADIFKYLNWLAEQKGEKAFTPNKNHQLTGFSGDKQLHIKINKVLEFDERLQLAKQKIDSCLERWSQDANDNLKVVIFDAFKVNKKGNVDTKRILGLRSLNIKDREWKAAMDLISEAVTITGTRGYLMFKVKHGQDAEWETLRLDLAGV
jgi:mRNA-degrading endonuclease YafQ of YafQ-DinJ toxin-antitoxin module